MQIHVRKQKSLAKCHTLQPVAVETTERVVGGAVLQAPVLVLNASYEPINICGARRALVLVLKGVARTEEEQGAMLHAAQDAGGDAVGDSAAGVSAHSASDAGALAEEHLAARSKHLPVLRDDSDVGGADAGPCDSAFAGRARAPGKIWWRAATGATAARATSCCMR